MTSNDNIISERDQPCDVKECDVQQTRDILHILPVQRARCVFDSWNMTYQRIFDKSSTRMTLVESAYPCEAHNCTLVFLYLCS
jgi:hypothetical protein